jgi:hypothetical protein
MDKMGAHGSIGATILANLNSAAAIFFQRMILAVGHHHPSGKKFFPESRQGNKVLQQHNLSCLQPGCRKRKSATIVDESQSPRPVPPTRSTAMDRKYSCC